MKVLFDQGTPVPLRRHLTGHVVDTAFECGWSNLKNGELLDAADRDGYGLLITTDQNLKHQQNLVGRKLAILQLPTNHWPTLKRHAREIAMAVADLKPGDYIELQF